MGKYVKAIHPHIRGGLSNLCNKKKPDYSKKARDQNTSVLPFPCLITKTTIHVKSPENNVDKREKIIWKNRRERKDVKKDNNMLFL